MKNSYIDKSVILELKKTPSKLKEFLENETNNSKRIFLLNKLGRLDGTFDKEPLVLLLEDPNDEIRYLAIKNLAKLGDPTLLVTFFFKAKNDESSKVRREAVSGIGRLRNKNAIEYLKELLFDSDPKISMQAIRGLLVFKDRNDVIVHNRNVCLPAFTIRPARSASISLTLSSAMRCKHRTQI